MMIERSEIEAKAAELESGAATLLDAANSARVRAQVIAEVGGPISHQLAQVAKVELAALPEELRGRLLGKLDQLLIFTAKRFSDQAATMNGKAQANTELAADLRKLGSVSAEKADEERPEEVAKQAT